jgi:hypothetical protein
MKKIKIAIGCLVQWYEVEIVEEYIVSLRQAIDHYGADNVIADFVITGNETLEKSEIKTSELLNRIASKVVKHLGAPIDLRMIYNQEDLITISSYRKEFNDKYCIEADVLVWGESDMLVPKEMFTTINQVHNLLQDTWNGIGKYITTFGICKMWDKSWKHLEHPEFTDKPFIEGDKDNWWSLRYNMTLDEMNAFNNKVEELDIRVFDKLKFNGCGLVISSDVIKSGVNIPQSAFFVHEDTAFMVMAKKILPDIKQIHVANILLVHNRKHPKKRSYIKGEEVIQDKSDVGKMRKTHKWYDIANKMSQANVGTLFDTQAKTYTWEDVWQALKG